MSFLSSLKFAFPSGSRLRTVKWGILQGLTLPLDLQYQSQIYFGTWEREHYQWTHQLSRGIHTYFDVGANQGIMSAYGAAKTNANRIFAFEPGTGLHEDILEAVFLNCDPNALTLDIVPKFVSSEQTDTTVCLDAYIDKVNYPIFLKIDVDGAEIDVLRGAEKLLTSGDSRVILETHSDKLENECISLLKDYEFTVKIIDNAWWRAILPEQRSCPHNRWLAAYRPEALKG